MTPHVLVVSRDPMLLHTRQLILGTFFQVHSAGRVCEAERLISRYSFDLIVLCYTLAEVECREVMSRVAGLKRPPRILLLTPVGSLPEGALPGQATMTEAGPYYLLKKSAELLDVDIKVHANLVEI